MSKVRRSETARVRDALRWSVAAEHSFRAALAHPKARMFWMEEGCRQLSFAFLRAEEAYRQLQCAEARLKGRPALSRLNGGRR